MPRKSVVLNFNCDLEIARIVAREQRRIQRGDPLHAATRTKAVRELIMRADAADRVAAAAVEQPAAEPAE